MNAIGFRVSPSKVTFAVVQTATDGKFAIAVTGEVVIPFALDTPRQLQLVRTSLLDLIEEHGITRAGLRTTEAIAPHKDSFRLNVEGVVQELLASGSVERFVAGSIVTVAALLGEHDRTVIKEFVGGKKPRQIVGEWEKLDDLEREAVLVAASACKPEVSA